MDKKTTDMNKMGRTWSKLQETEKDKKAWCEMVEGLPIVIRR